MGDSFGAPVGDSFRAPDRIDPLLPYDVRERTLLEAEEDGLIGQFGSLQRRLPALNAMNVDST